MSAVPVSQPWADLYDTWFGRIELSPEYYRERLRYWFYGENHKLDVACATYYNMFLSSFQAHLSQNHLSWKQHPQGLISLILLFDQIPRNAFRGKPKAYEFDDFALKLTLEVIGTPLEFQLNPIERIFLYMPLEHAENSKLQALNVEKFKQLYEQSPEAVKEFTYLGYTKALDHQRVVDTYGRFPHRNSILSRINSSAEEVYMKSFAGEF